MNDSALKKRKASVRVISAGKGWPELSLSILARQSRGDPYFHTNYVQPEKRILHVPFYSPVFLLETKKHVQPVWQIRTFSMFSANSDIGEGLTFVSRIVDFPFSLPTTRQAWASHRMNDKIHAFLIYASLHSSPSLSSMNSQSPHALTIGHHANVNARLDRMCD
jgi:hypothetical protein